MKFRFRQTTLSKEWRDYFLSAHFWAPCLNWMIPISTISEIPRDPKYISGTMTVALTFYSIMSMRFAWKVNPRNLLLFSCHFVNLNAQIVQGTRFLLHHNKISILSRSENEKTNIHHNDYDIVSKIKTTKIITHDIITPSIDNK